MLSSTVAFGDTVRIVSAPETERLGIAGKSGPVYGETTPTVSGVDVIGTLTRDFALNVYLDELKASFWLPEHLVELVDRGEGTTITLNGVNKRWVRTADGGWDESDVQSANFSRRNVNNSNLDGNRMFVEIVNPPIGEAPEWVREAWVGLRLPLARKRRHRWHGVGVVTGPKSLVGQFWALITGHTVNISGYAVNAKAAVDLLAGTNDAAADWWRQNSPHLLAGNRYFVFDAAPCREVESR